MSITNELPPKTAPVLDRKIANEFLEGRATAQRAADSFEALRRIVEMISDGQQVDSFRAVELIVAYRSAQYVNFCEDPAKGRRIANEVRKWQAATVRHPHTGAPVPQLVLTAPQAAELNRLHSMFDDIDLEE